ncbi:unnamed protein product [Dimorphilus gyrociliatus]|uniref:Uncharacterized protein n=1 Tax=Dimorphilus gyrociliatus TaxID=2664684 RepID=A0A7I8VTH9_9ANNE|nr:unnamed protein product [Dimorphilus gyrociliatus]
MRRSVVVFLFLFCFLIAGLSADYYEEFNGKRAPWFVGKRDGRLFIGKKSEGIDERIQRLTELAKEMKRRLRSRPFYIGKRNRMFIDKRDSNDDLTL